ncbi:merR family regulatory protein [Rhodococcus sp. Br-6]|nr:merR family regulatory protein [Rhodococcus sp. Br-6]
MPIRRPWCGGSVCACRPSGSGSMRISDIAQAADTTARTVRHCHRLGLLDEPKRLANGYHAYDMADLVRLMRVRWLAGAGVPLGSVSSMIAATTDDTADADFAALIDAIEAERRVLATKNGQLQQVLAVHRAGRPVSPLPKGLAVLFSELIGRRTARPGRGRRARRRRDGPGSPRRPRARRPDRAADVLPPHPRRHRLGRAPPARRRRVVGRRIPARPSPTCAHYGCVGLTEPFPPPAPAPSRNPICTCSVTDTGPGPDRPPSSASAAPRNPLSPNSTSTTDPLFPKGHLR